jgi:hypothetical protein
MIEEKMGEQLYRPDLRRIPVAQRISPIIDAFQDPLKSRRAVSMGAKFWRVLRFSHAPSLEPLLYVPTSCNYSH